MNVTGCVSGRESPLDPPFGKACPERSRRGGRRRARGNFREWSAPSVVRVRALKLLFGRARRTALLVCLLSLSLPACSPKPEPSKSLVKISNVKLWRTDEQTLKVSLDYDLETGVRLPLPYKEVLVFPLEPKVKLAGTLEPFVLSIGTVGVTLQIPKDAGFNWQDLNDKDTCCVVSLKGMQEEPGSKTPRYERISNEVRVLPPQISG
jgi:hypothetical protein